MGDSMKILNGDSLEILKSLEENSLDSLVTDPPYGLSQVTPQMMTECLKAWSNGDTWTPKNKKGGFMGKGWDSFVPQPDLWKEVYRVMKHGAYGVVFAGTRTQDLMSISLRLAGFEIRDVIMWIYGSGFPKSHNVALGIDKKLGHSNRGKAIPTASRYQASDTEEKNKLTSNPVGEYTSRDERSKQWVGYGTALKPAYEPIILIRKPPEGTVADNVLKWGVGGINVDATRIPLQEGENTGVTPQSNKVTEAQRGFRITTEKIGPMNDDWKKGRWPANIMLDVESAQELDGQSGIKKSGVAGSKSRAWGVAGRPTIGKWEAKGSEGYGDTGGASRFFYTTKANKKEREAGLDRFEEKEGGGLSGTKDQSMLTGSGNVRNNIRKNIHPTVKPIDLMRYLVRLVTPTGGTVLEPFLGSGTTLCACALEGFQGVGIEREEEYVEIARARVNHWLKEAQETFDDLPLFRDTPTKK
jgi:site-specific DNA-methyltransferase (adenine-specific)